MKWYRKFDVDMPSEFMTVCKHYVVNNDPEPPFKYFTVGDSAMWTIWHDYITSDYIADARVLVSNTTGLSLGHKKGFVVLWRFDDNFKRSPIHIDIGRGAGGNHNGSICTALVGDFKLHRHGNDAAQTIIDSVELNDKSLVALNNTRFPHSVEGNGILVVFGVDLDTDPEEYWRDD